VQPEQVFSQSPLKLFVVNSILMRDIQLRKSLKPSGQITGVNRAKFEHIKPQPPHSPMVPFVIRFIFQQIAGQSKGLIPHFIWSEIADGLRCLGSTRFTLWDNLLLLHSTKKRGCAGMKSLLPIQTLCRYTPAYSAYPPPQATPLCF